MDFQEALDLAEICEESSRQFNQTKTAFEKNVESEEEVINSLKNLRYMYYARTEQDTLAQSVSTLEVSGYGKAAR